MKGIYIRVITIGFAQRSRGRKDMALGESLGFVTARAKGGKGRVR